MIYTPHSYQTRATDFIVANQACALFLDMGLGKTVSTLTAIDMLKNEYLEIEKTLVIAPKSVARNTWSAESAKWDHLKHLRLSIVMGSPKQRSAALEADADIYVINRDNIKWLVSLYKADPWPFDVVVIDESSSFKNPASQRFKALRKIRPQIKRLIELTGTPSPNGLMDLWAQIWLLDRGKRLGRTLSDYRSEYFTPGRRNGAVIYEWSPKKGARQKISRRISDISISMQASDYLQMPDVINGGMDIALPEIREYQKFEKEQLMQLDGQDIEAVTAATLTNKLLQFSGGAMYDDTHTWHEVSRAKLEALHDIVDSTEEPVLIYYQYKSELERIHHELKEYSPVNFRGETDILEAWNGQKIRVMIAHPASVAYGLNMQQGGHIIIWYTPTWNLELYTQSNARLYRQGQAKTVIIYHIIALGTMDERVMKSISSKNSGQNELLRQIKELREKYR